MMKLLIRSFCIFILPITLFANDPTSLINVSILQVPIPVPSETHNYIVYELQIENYGNKSFRLGLVDIADHMGKSIKSYFAESLKHNIIFYNDKGPVQTNDLVLKKDMGAFVFVTLAFPKSGPISPSFQNRIFFVDVNADKTQATADSVAYVVFVGENKPVVLEPPLRGTNWVAAGALSPQSYHRRAVLYINDQFYLAQRYAVDWEQVCNDGRSFHSNAHVNNNWNAFGHDVLAAAEGVVVKVRDGLPENTPPGLPKSPLKFQDVPGNHIVTKINQNGRDYYILYAHLQPGSIQVHEGDPVKQGQVIGTVGNTGNSAAPHLHLHVMNSSDPLESEGVPFIFKTVALTGTTKPIDDEFGLWKPLITKKEGLSSNISPLEGQVFDFSQENRFKCP